MAWLQSVALTPTLEDFVGRLSITDTQLSGCVLSPSWYQCDHNIIELLHLGAVIVQSGMAAAVSLTIIYRSVQRHSAVASEALDTRLSVRSDYCSPVD